jgi:hypothetical protein
MVNNVDAAVPQYTFLILFEGFNMPVVEISVICRFCIQNHLTWMMFSVLCNIELAKCGCSC